MTHTVAIFGGSFNPPHIAHVLAAAFVLTMEEDVDELWVVPCFQHPFAKSLAPFDDRLEMCKRAFAQIPQVVISTIERDLGGESRTIRTVKHLAQQQPDWKLRIIIGTDILAEAPRWHSFNELRRLAPPIVLARKGWNSDDTSAGVFPKVSSSEVRDAIARGDTSWAGTWIPPTVLNYAQERSLYGIRG